MEGQTKLPDFVLERLKGMRHSDNMQGLFTSDLSVSEYLLVKEAGFEPLGLVMGSSVYHIGFQFARMKDSTELTVLTQAMYEARELAMARMEEEAAVLGADGIVGVKLVISSCEWGEHLAEFQAIGTAVIAKDRSKNFKAKEGRPFASDLSGQEFWTLLKTGYRPLSLVMGCCVYHIAYQGMLKNLGNMGKNIELPNFTQALYDARELAMQRIQKEAQDAGAEGVVGVTIDESSYGWSSHTIEFCAIGAAVTPIATDHEIATPDLVMVLN